MLNLNYNIIGSVNVGGAQPFRAGALFSVRNDIYSSSIVVAIPGNLFRDGDYETQFGMTNPWDDMSAYVRGNGSPIGSNLTVEILTSGSGILQPTSSLIKWAGGDTKYNTSLYVNSTSSLRALNTWPQFEGANLSYSSQSFVIETWAAWEVTASLSPSGAPGNYIYSPNRLFAYKYDPGEPGSSAYFWETTWGGDIDEPGIGVLLISGSTRFVSDSGGGEYYAYGTSSVAITPYQFNHYAVSYTRTDAIDPQYDYYLRLYINGVCQAEYDVEGQNINQDTTELLQIFGALDSGGDVYPGRGAAYFQDFRMYNGTNKNYTGSIIPLPESMVLWQ
jgi:hypothetical protein